MNAMQNVSYGLYIVTAKTSKSNGCVANTLVQHTTNPNQVTITLNKTNHTTEMIKETKKFNVSMLDVSAIFELIKKFGRPITSTSANLAGDAAPSIYAEITEHMKESVDYVVQLYHDVLTKPKPSTIIRLYEDNSFDIIRQ